MDTLGSKDLDVLKERAEEINKESLEYIVGEFLKNKQAKIDELVKKIKEIGLTLKQLQEKLKNI